MRPWKRSVYWELFDRWNGDRRGSAGTPGRCRARWFKSAVQTLDKELGIKTVAILTMQDIFALVKDSLAQTFAEHGWSITRGLAR